MAPSLRSARTDHPKLGINRLHSVDGCLSRRTHGGGGFLRSKWRAGAGVMFANCLISTGMVLLLVQCALATEDETTYDASGSSSSPSEPTVTAVPAHPLADIPVVDEVHSEDGAVSEGGGLRGQPAFSSVLTLLAGTDKHPSSFSQSRTAPTITRDKNHTSHQPSDVSSQGSEVSSSSSSVEPSKNVSTSSGLNTSFSYKRTIAAQVVTVVSTLPVSIMDGDRSIISSPSPTSSPTLLLSTLFPRISPPNNLTTMILLNNTDLVRGTLSSSTMSLTPLSASTLPSTAPSTSAVLSPLLTRILSSSNEWISRGASSRGRWPQTQTGAHVSATQRWTEGLTSAHSTMRSVVDLPTVLNRSQSTAVTSSDSKTITGSNIHNKPDISNKEPTRLLNSLWNHSYGEQTETVILNVSQSTNVTRTSAKITDSTSNQPIFLSFLNGTTQTQDGSNISLTHYWETSAIAFYGNKIPSDQSQLVTLQIPTSAPLPASHGGYTGSALTRQRVTGTPYWVDKDINVSDSQPASAVTMASANSLYLNPGVSLNKTSTAYGVFFTIPSRTSNMKADISSSSISKKVAPLSTTNKSHLDFISGSNRVPNFNMNISHKIKETSVFQTHQNTRGYTMSTTTTKTTPTKSQSFYSLNSVDMAEGVTQELAKGSTKGHKGWMTLKMIFTSNTTLSLSNSSLSQEELQTHTTYQSSHLTSSLHRLNPNRSSTDYTSGPPVSGNSNTTTSSQLFVSSQFTMSSSGPGQASVWHQIVQTHSDKISSPITNHWMREEPIFYSDSSSQGPSHSSVEPLFLEAYVTMDHANKDTVSFQRNSTNTSHSFLSVVHDPKTTDPKTTDHVFHKKTIPNWLITTPMTSSKTKKGFLNIVEHSEDSSTVTTSSTDFDILFVPFKRQSYSEDIQGTHKYVSLSSLSDIIVSMRTDAHSQDTVTNSSSNRYSTAVLLSANTTSKNRTDSTNSRSSLQVTEPQTTWKPANSVISESTLTQFVNTSVILDTINYLRPGGDTNLEHSREGGEQSISQSLVLSSTVTATLANVSYSVQPNSTEQFHVGETPAKPWRFSLSPANLRSPIAVRKPPGATDESDNSLQISHTSHDTMTSPPDTLLRSAPNNKQSSAGTVIDIGFPESISATEITFRNDPSAHILATDYRPITNSMDSSQQKGTSQADLWKLAHSSHSSISSLTSSSSSSPISKPESEILPLFSPYMSSTSAIPPPPSSSWSSSLPTKLISQAGIHPNSHPTMSTVSLSSLSPYGPIMDIISLPVASSLSQEVTKTFVIAETGTEEKSTGTSTETGLHLPKENQTSLAPFPPVNNKFPVTTTVTSQVSPLTPQQDITTSPQTTTESASTKTKAPMTTQSTKFTRPIPESLSTTTLQPTTSTRRTTTTVTTRTPVSRRTFTPHMPRTSPRGGAATVIFSPFTTTTTEAPPQQCNITERMWVKTVVSIYVRRNRLDSIQRQNLRRGLSQGLRKALNDSTVQAQVETVFGSPNMTVAYHVTGGDLVYPPSVVLEGLEAYGRDRLIADLRQYLPMVTALPVPAALWRPNPATGFQVKTVLRFVGAGDEPRSCRFSQVMEQRLENVFSEAQAKVLHPHSKLFVQMLSVFQFTGSPAVSLVYTVKNGTVYLNGTTASNLLSQLTAELVGYFLFYPPLIIAEPLEYHNLNTSIATRDFWVITVIQDVDNSSLEGQYQSFASLMEQRLAELFVVAGQQGIRFRRATNVGSYTVQMVSMRRVTGLKNPAEITYYVQQNGIPLLGTSAAKVLNTVDSQTMALTLGFFVQLQAEPVVKNPPNNLWIIAAVLAPIAVVTLIIIIITAVLCRKNKNDFKADAIGNLNPRAKMVYRRDVGYFHQPVQGFDYAKQHLGQHGGDEETLPVTQDTLRMSLQIRDTPLSLEKAKMQQDSIANKKNLTSDIRKRLPSEDDGSVISDESERLNSSRGLTVQKVTAQHKLTKEETGTRDDPYKLSSGSLQLISIKPIVAQPSYSQPASSDRSQDSAILNGEVSLALKQKSDIEHYRNKLRLKAKRKGYYDFPSTNASNSSSSRALEQRPWQGHERVPSEHGRSLEPDDERGSTYVKSHRRHSQAGQPAYHSRQSLNSPSPGGNELDLLVMRERPRRGIRNSGYDTEPELIEETNVDRLMGPRGYMYGRGVKGHSETSTLSSQPSIDEVRQQMHLLLEEAFSLASGGHSTSGRNSHHHQYSPTPPPLPYTDAMVTSAPGTMRRGGGMGGLRWVPSYGADMYQCSLPKPAFRFTQLPDMAMGSPPPPLPPRTGPSLGTSLKRSASDLGPNGRNSEISVTSMQNPHDNPYGPTSRVALPSLNAEQPVSNYSGNPITAVYAIPATSPDYSEYCVSPPPTSYHSPSWMSYPPEPEDVPPQWADSVPLPGYVEAFPHPRYPQGSPRLSLQCNQAPEQDTTASNTASQQRLPQAGKMIDSVPLSSLSTSALVEAIRQEVAKLAKKQSDMFEFQV